MGCARGTLTSCTKSISSNPVQGGFVSGFVGGKGREGFGVARCAAGDADSVPGGPLPLPLMRSRAHVPAWCDARPASVRRTRRDSSRMGRSRSRSPVRDRSRGRDRSRSRSRDRARSPRGSPRRDRDRGRVSARECVPRWVVCGFLCALCVYVCRMRVCLMPPMMC